MIISKGIRHAQRMLLSHARACFMMATLAGCTTSDPVPGAPAKPTDKRIVSFSFDALTPPATGIIDDAAGVINVVVPIGTSMKALVPTIAISDKATIAPAPGTAQDFSVPVVYTVTASDSSTQQYTVTVKQGKLNAKRITRFVLGQFAPSIEATISETTKTITAVVPGNTDLATITPTLIQVSPKATVTPLPGTAANFYQPVVYTVTAEDGTKQTYEVTITLNNTVSFTVSQMLPASELEQGDTLSVTGTNLANGAGVTFIHAATSATVTARALPGGDGNSFQVAIPRDLPLGAYRIKVNVGQESKIVDGYWQVVPHRPVVYRLQQSPLEAGEMLNISGDFFRRAGNVLLMRSRNGLADVQPTVTFESEQLIAVQVPFNAAPGIYDLFFVVEGRLFDVRTPVEIALTTRPTIWGLNKYTFAIGEQMIITGVNFYKLHVPVNIRFMPEGGGVTIVRAAISSVDGTQITYTLPTLIPPGSYTIGVAVDGVYSNEITTPIVITR